MLAKAFPELFNRPGDEWQLCCPVCGFEYVHIQKVVVNQGGMVTTVTRRNDTVDPDGPTTGRGSRVTIDFSCECSHQFSVSFQFHKGQTFVDFAEREPLPEGGVGESLWRD